jgi:hypothetical protein
MKLCFASLGIATLRKALLRTAGGALLRRGQGQGQGAKPFA